MKRTCIAISVAALCGVASAQSMAVSPDPIFSRSEGAGTVRTFGAYAAGRYQFIDGNHRGSSSILKELCFRHDHRNYDVTTGMGRSWTGVQVRVFQGELSTFNSTFSTNSSTVPTLVFSNSVSWPIVLGASDPLPNMWRIAFPFSTNYAYGGNLDIGTDLTFEGGSLANSASWSGSTRHSYYLDSFFVGSFASGSNVILGHTNGGCVDGGSSTTNGASVKLDMATYGPNMANVVFRNKYFILATGQNFAKNSTMMLALAFRAVVTGVPVGIPCNSLYLNPAVTWFLYPQATNSVGAMSPFAFGLSAGLTNYNPAWAGFNLVLQGAWTDSQNGRLKLSSASRNSFSALPLPNTAAVRMKTAYDYNAANATATFTGDGDSTAIPIICYRR
jgi:hypothetical protein